MSMTCRAVALGLLVFCVAAMHTVNSIRSEKSPTVSFGDALHAAKDMLWKAEDAALDSSPSATDVAQLFFNANRDLDRVSTALMEAALSKSRSLKIQSEKGQTKAQFNDEELNTVHEELKTARTDVRTFTRAAASKVDYALKSLGDVSKQPDIMEATRHHGNSAQALIASLVAELDEDDDSIGSVAAKGTTKNIDVGAASRTVSGALESVENAKARAEDLWDNDKGNQNAKAVKELFRYQKPHFFLSSVNNKLMEATMEEEKLRQIAKQAEWASEKSDKKSKSLKADLDQQRNDASDAAQQAIAAAKEFATQALAALGNCKAVVDNLADPTISGDFSSAQDEVNELLKLF